MAFGEFPKFHNITIYITNILVGSIAIWDKSELKVVHTSHYLSGKCFKKTSKE